MLANNSSGCADAALVSALSEMDILASLKEE